ncbi:tRNA (adenosine(37)-N6)-threonylcarbamoyltransferase complex dimerization subunit type 1 TsaB [bacterium]|nr:tRNA (adenosine(37)-N6)-threonylcarbamoyltransferase complex dimerization subunit type 1 TsaB [bacterium]
MSESPLLLCLDTSTPVGSLALAGPQGLVATRTSSSPASHTERLFSLIQNLLEGAGLTLPQVEGLALAAGPGSFTGLRIAAATAKTLAWSLGKPLYAVGTLECLAWGAHMEGLPTLALLDAGQGEFYAAVYLWADSPAEGRDLLAPCALSGEALAAALEDLDLPGGRLICAGAGAEAAWEGLLCVKGLSLSRPAARLNLPEAAFLGELVLAAPQRRRVQDIFTFEPTYLRSGQVQLRLGK